MLPAIYLAFPSVSSRMSDVAFDLFANILAMTLRLFSASSKVYLLASINLRSFTSVVSRYIYLVVTDSTVSGMVMKWLRFSYCWYRRPMVKWFLLFREIPQDCSGTPHSWYNKNVLFLCIILYIRHDEYIAEWQSCFLNGIMFFISRIKNKQRIKNL